MHSYARELEESRALVQRAGEIALSYFRKPLDVVSKADESPVTAADRAGEQFIARALEESFPDDGVLGEEGSDKPSRSGRRWIVDPIDGTRDFVRGNPMWAVFLALEDAGEVVAGAVALPAFGEVFSAARGAGAWANGTRVHVSSISAVSEAVVCVDALNHMTRYPFGARLVEWLEPFWAVRCMGGCFDALMVARGQAELWIETSGKPWDFAALKIIAEESGARFFDFSGRPTIYGGNAVICNPAMEAHARAFVAAP